MFRKLLGVAAVGLLIVGMAGCGGTGGGPRLYPAKGKVTYKGQPVARANVTFVSGQGQVLGAITNEAGEFTLSTQGRPGAAPGTYKVAISKMSQREGMPANPKPEDMAKMVSPKGDVPQAKNELPGKYMAPETSGLTATVTEDGAKNNFTFDLAD